MVSKVILYIAKTQDGFIAKKDGNIDFLNELTMPSETEEKYKEFISTIDTVIMGYKTYHQIVNKLSPDEWPYKGTNTFVFTSKTKEKSKFSNENITFITGDIKENLAKIKNQAKKDIWLLGGADLAKQFHN